MIRHSSFVILIALSLFVHSLFVLRGLGEPDAARLAIDAIVWHQTGTLNMAMADYRPRTSPLYLHAMKKALDWGLPARSLSGVMNWSNVVMASLTLVPLYLLFRRLTDAKSAAAACVLYSFAPTFWIANIYGMPHLPSFGLFLTALLIFASSLDGGRRKFAWGAVAATLCMVGACALKADIVLCCGAFVGVLLCERKLGLRKGGTGVSAAARRAGSLCRLLVAGAIVAVGVLATSLYSRLIAPSVGALQDFNAGIPNRFPFRVEKAFSSWNLRVTAASFGPVLAWAVLGAVVYCGLRGRRHWRLVALVLLWSVPPQIVWGMKFGNSARHMMTPAAPLVLLLAVAVFSFWKTLRWPIVATALLIMSNYASTSPNTSTVVPSSRIFESVAYIQDMISLLHRYGRDFAAVRADKKFLLASWTCPHILYESIADARSLEVTARGNEMRIVTPEGRTELIGWRYVLKESDLACAEPRRRDGWFVWRQERHFDSESPGLR